VKLPRFLDRYLVYTAGNETPEIMHLWVGLSTLAGCAERRVWLDFGFFPLYFNLYVVLVAPAGVCSKSTSIDYGLDILKAAGYEVLEDAATKEKIIVEMAERVKGFEPKEGRSVFLHSSVTFVATELNMLLATGAETVKFLVTIWDKRDSYSYKTKSSGEFEIPNPYFNLLSAATPEWFATCLGDDITNTGFLARCIIVFENKRRASVPFVEITDEQKKAKAELIQMALEIGKFFGPLKVEDDAKQFYSEWYRSQPLPDGEDYRIAGYLVRKQKIFVLKVASLLALGDLRTTVTVDDIKTALDIFDRTEAKMRLAFIASGRNRLAYVATRIVELLLSSGGKMKLSDVVQRFYHEVDANDMKQILLMLEQMKVARRVSEGGEPHLVVNKVQARVLLGGEAP